MNRRELLAKGGAVTTIGAAGCTQTRRVDTRDGERPATDDVDDWPMFLFDRTNRRSFSRERTAVDDPSVRWSLGTDDAIWASPVVVDGTLYVGSYDGHLYAISIDGGDVEWRYEAGDRIDGSPAVANGTVYFGSFDRNVYALDARTGEERWIYGTKGIVRSSPTVAGGVVYIGAHCRTAECGTYYDVRWPEVGYVYALDAERGDLRWRYETGDGVLSTPAVDAETVFVGSSDNRLYALDAASGEQRWSYETTDSIMSSPTSVDGRVYVGNVVGEVAAFDAADGSLEWRFDADRFATDDTIHSVVITGSPVVADGTVYAGSTVPAHGETYGELHAISASDGTPEWSASPYGHSIGSSPVVVNDVVYFGAHTFGPAPDDGPGLYALEADGTEQWSHTVDREDHAGFGSSPAILGDTLYVGGTDGHVYAFDLG